jgi:hypothetical protein
MAVIASRQTLHDHLRDGREQEESFILGIAITLPPCVSDRKAEIALLKAILCRFAALAVAGSIADLR